MKHAEKLEFDINLGEFKFEECTLHREYTKLQRYGRGLSGIAFGSETKYIKDVDHFLKQLPKQLLDIEVPYVFLLDIKTPDQDCAVLPAHIDINKTCGINVYLQANGEVTKFYNWDANTRLCSYVEEFCAQPGEVWLMNNQQPHSVDLVKGLKRRILTYSFVKTPYNVVLEILNANNQR